MNKQKVHTYRFETLSLLRLKLTLMNARKDSPPGVAKKDRNEELALKLIETLKTKYKKFLPIIN
ncbi:MAG TPA: hypothetical protein VK249_22360 [Anaerolineales bacterium]|nr:hypothetical protein [Anaerolineales bacterium]